MRSLPPGKLVTDVTERSRAQTLSVERRVRRLESDVRAKNAKIAALEELLRGELDSETAARAQSELRRQTDFVQSIDAALHVLLYERVADGERWTYGFGTERFTQTFGRPPEAAQTSTTDWLMGLLDPADRDRVSTSYRAVLKAGGGLWRSEFRAKTLAGKYSWFHMVANFEVRDGREIRSVGMLQDISLEKAERERADYARDYDELTGIFSRSYFERAASKALEHWMTTGKFFAIVIVDIDDFHEINKVYGVDAGGVLRRELAQSLAGMMRESDLIARFGDDQIGIIADVRGGDEARAFAHKLVESLRADFRFGGNFVGLSVSAGVSLPRDGGATATDLFHDASVALYGALAAGGSTEIVYSSGMGVEYVARVTLKAELREALAQAQFELYYQPKIDVESGCVIGCEALLRWNHPTLGLQAPGIFIPVAEQSGLIVPLGEWVVFEACRQSVRWREAGLSPVPIAINLSPVQFTRSDVFEMLSKAFAMTGASPGALDVEVTESVFIDFSDELVATLEKVRALGIEISLDDFGTGFSSLAYLTRLPLSIIKIDQTFVRGASENPSDAAIVRWVAQLAEELGLRVVAEGVETQEQLDFVRRAGCAEAQGYFFSRPVPAASFAKLLKPAALVSAAV